MGAPRIAKNEKNSTSVQCKRYAGQLKNNISTITFQQAKSSFVGLLRFGPELHLQITKETERSISAEKNWADNTV